MTSPKVRQAPIFALGLCLWFAPLPFPGVLHAQTVGPPSDGARETLNVTKLSATIDTPRATALSQSIKREAERQALASADRQQAPQPKRSWIARHKVLVITLAAATPFIVWGSLLWHTCANDGC